MAQRGMGRRGMGRSGVARRGVGREARHVRGVDDSLAWGDSGPHDAETDHIRRLLCNKLVACSASFATSDDEMVRLGKPKNVAEMTRKATGV